MEEIDLATARRIAVTAQGLAPHQLAEPSKQPSVTSVLERLGCIQIDSIQAVRRSQEIVLLSRGVPREETGPALYSRSAGLFETWGHAHSMLPRAMWPLLHWRRDLTRRVGLSGPPYDEAVGAAVLAQIEADGPMTHSQLGTVRGRGWERSSAVKVACEWLASMGELAVVSRDATWARIYCTPEQAGLPREETLTVEESLWRTIAVAAGALGIMTRSALRDYFRFPTTPLLEEYLRSELVPVRVSSLPGTWYASAALLDQCAREGWADGWVSVLSPFDSLVWHRPRQRVLFGKDYRLEIYVPAHKRTFGYYAMPILRDEQLIGRVAARATGGSVEIENLEVDDPDALAEVRRAVTATLESWAS